MPLYLVTGLLALLLLAFTVSPVREHQVINPPEIRFDSGFAYWTPVAPSPDIGWASALFELRADTASSPSRSTLLVLEDGRPLGPAHALHSVIRAEGAGRFSHWGDSVYFAASENSDPRSNGRTYAYVGVAYPKLWLYVVALALALLTLYRAALKARPSARRRIRQSVHFLCVPASQSNASMRVGAAILLGGLVVGPLAVFFVWASGTTIPFGLAGFLPFSDALGNYRCASQFADMAQSVEWCSRRPIYPAMLGTLLLVLGRDLHLILLAQAAMLSFAVVIYAREIGRWLGPIYGVGAGLFAAFLMQEYALNVVITEVLGLTLGMLSITILLRAGETKARWLAYLGLTVCAIGMNARPGALLSLPLIVLWATSLAWPNQRGMVRSFALAISAVASGFLFQALVVEAVGGHTAASHGNFSYTLYGLSVGGDWTTIYSDHPELFVGQSRGPTEVAAPLESLAFSRAYQLAASNILDEPWVFIASLLRNLNKYFDWILLNGLLRPIGTVGAVGLWLAALSVTAWRARHDPRAALVLAISLGEAASAPLIAGDGGVRVFAVTAAAQALPILVLFSFGVRSFAEPVPVNPPHRRRHPASWPSPRPWAALALTTVIALLLLLPLLPIRQLFRDPVLTAQACERSLDTVIGHLRPGGPSLTVTPWAADPETWPRRISAEELDRGLNPAHWYAESFQRLPPMQILFVRQQLEQGYGDMWWLYAPGVSELPMGQDLLLCVDRGRRRAFAGRDFAEIVSYRPL